MYTKHCHHLLLSNHLRRHLILRRGNIYLHRARKTPGRWILLYRGARTLQPYFASDFHLDTSLDRARKRAPFSGPSVKPYHISYVNYCMQASKPVFSNHIYSPSQLVLVSAGGYPQFEHFVGTKPHITYYLPIRHLISFHHIVPCFWIDWNGPDRCTHLGFVALKRWIFCLPILPLCKRLFLSFERSNCTKPQLRSSSFIVYVAIERIPVV